MRYRDIEPLSGDEVVESFGELPAERPRRPWLLMVASLMLVVLVAVVWGKWGESRTEADQLRAEVKQVYREAEGLRTQAVQAEQRAGLLDQQVRSLRAELTELLQRMESAGVEMPVAKAKAAAPAPAKQPVRRVAPARSN
jgi:hypothetical protein